MEGGAGGVQTAGSWPRAPAPSHLRSLTCAIPRGGAGIRSPGAGAVGSQPPASLAGAARAPASRAWPGSLWQREAPAKQPGSARPFLRRVRPPVRGWGRCSSSAVGRGRLRACGRRLPAGAPVWWPKAGGRAGSLLSAERGSQCARGGYCPPHPSGVLQGKCNARGRQERVQGFSAKLQR